MKTVLTLLATLALGLLTIVYGVFAIETLWDWFATAQWPTKPTTQSWYGVALILSVARCGKVMSVATYNEDANDTINRALTSAIGGLLAITFVLAFGWVLK